jgi:hypothetical protein
MQSPRWKRKIVNRPFDASDLVAMLVESEKEAAYSIVMSALRNEIDAGESSDANGDLRKRISPVPLAINSHFVDPLGRVKAPLDWIVIATPSGTANVPKTAPFCRNVIVLALLGANMAPPGGGVRPLRTSPGRCSCAVWLVVPARDVVNRIAAMAAVASSLICMEPPGEIRRHLDRFG